MRKKARKIERRDRCRKSASGHLWCTSWAKRVRRCAHCGDRRLVRNGRRYRVDVESLEREDRLAVEPSDLATTKWWHRLPEDRRG